MPLFFVPKAFDNIPDDEIDRLERKINWLWVNRKLVTHMALHGDMKGFFKRPMGKYRIIYEYNETQDEMIVHLVGNRDSIYKRKT